MKVITLKNGSCINVIIGTVGLLLDQNVICVPPFVCVGCENRTELQPLLGKWVPSNLPVTICERVLRP